MAGIERIGIVGAGTMGRGIARVAAAAGIEVRLHDQSREVVRAALEAVRAALERDVERGRSSSNEAKGTLGRIAVTPGLDEAVAGAGLVIESVPESLELKRRIFGELDRAAPRETLLASNTSSLSISRIAGATRRPERVVGLHFFNPAHRMPLLEVVRGERTSEETVHAALEFGRRLGKDPIVVRDTPGFATSRLGLVLGLEAMRMLEQGVATAEEIDKAMTLGYGHPVGPLRLSDLVGLDVRLAIADHLHGELGGKTFEPPRILRRMVAEGRLGRKSGRGFYEW
jgi:3-hydroxybutyryl-CoA dehydrogenase